jgi:hypothetical protein
MLKSFPPSKCTDFVKYVRSLNDIPTDNSEVKYLILINFTHVAGFFVAYSADML